jgi:hypothetical protein
MGNWEANQGRHRASKRGASSFLCLVLFSASLAKTIKKAAAHRVATATLAPPSAPTHNDVEPVPRRKSMQLGKSASVGQKRLDGGDGCSRRDIIICNNVFGGSG